MIKRLLFKDPSRTIGTIGFLVSAAAALGIISNQMSEGLEKILAGLLAILVPASAEAIRTKAYAPASVARVATEAATEVVSDLGAATVGVVGLVPKAAETIIEGTVGRVVGGLL